MARHTEIILDGETYKIPTLTLDQLERLAEMQASVDPQQSMAASAKTAFGMFKIVIEEITPKIEGPVRASMEEVTAAINAVMSGAGVVNAAANPQLAAKAAA